MANVRYKRTTIKLSDSPRTKHCVLCFDDKPRKTQRHHWRYAHDTRKVKKNPELALENTVEVCYRHHLKANSLKDFINMPMNDIGVLASSMDKLTLKRFKVKIKFLELVYDMNRGIK